MNTTERNELIRLLSNELYNTVSTYEEVKKDKPYVVAGYGVTNFESKTAIQRRIMELVEVLLGGGE